MRRARRAGGLLAASVVLGGTLWWALSSASFPDVAPDGGDVSASPLLDEAPRLDAAPVVVGARRDPVLTEVRVRRCEDDEPLEHAVLLVEASSGVPVEFEELSAGHWRVRAAKDAVVRCIAAAAGRVPAERWYTAARMRTVDIHLATEVPMEVRVVDADTTDPLPGVRVYIEGDPLLHGGRNVARCWDGRTDDRGRVLSPEGGADREVRMTLVSPGHLTARRLLDAALPIWTEGLRTATQPARVTVRAVDDRGRPVDDAVVSVLDHQGVPWLPERARPRTGADGSVTLEVSHEDDVGGVTVEAPGRRTAVLHAGSGDLTARLLSAGGPAISLVDARGEPMANVTVRAVPLHAGPLVLLGALPVVTRRTGEDGTVFFPDLPTGVAVRCDIGGVDGHPLAVATLDETASGQQPAITLGAHSVLTVYTGMPRSRCAVFVDGSPPVRGTPPTVAGADHPGTLTIHRSPGDAICVVAADGPLRWGRVVVPTDIQWEGLSHGDTRLLSVEVADVDGRGAAGARVRVAPAADAPVPPSLVDTFRQEAVLGGSGRTLLEIPSGMDLDVDIRLVGRVGVTAAVKADDPAPVVHVTLPAPGEERWIECRRGGDVLANTTLEILRGHESHLPRCWTATDDRGIARIVAPGPGDAEAVLLRPLDETAIPRILEAGELRSAARIDFPRRRGAGPFYEVVVQPSDDLPAGTAFEWSTSIDEGMFLSKTESRMPGYIQEKILMKRRQRARDRDAVKAEVGRASHREVPLPVHVVIPGGIPLRVDLDNIARIDRDHVVHVTFPVYAIRVENAHERTAAPVLVSRDKAVGAGSLESQLSRRFLVLGTEPHFLAVGDTRVAVVPSVRRYTWDGERLAQDLAARAGAPQAPADTDR